MWGFASIHVNLVDFVFKNKKKHILHAGSDGNLIKQQQKKRKIPRCSWLNDFCSFEAGVSKPASGGRCPAQFSSNPN